MSINKRIKQVRQSLEMSQISFSKGIYLSNGYYAGIELENRKANDRIIELITNKYGVNRHWLETGEGKMFETPAPDKDLEQIIAIYHGLQPQFKEFGLLFLKHLLKLQENQPPKRRVNKKNKSVDSLTKSQIVSK
jgi:transcriptional regulator with XRE-family HTH domain